jgi:hypothetical protein
MCMYCFRNLHSTHEVLVKLLLDSCAWPSIINISAVSKERLCLNESYNSRNTILRNTEMLITVYLMQSQIQSSIV